MRGFFLWLLLSASLAITVMGLKEKEPIPEEDGGKSQYELIGCFVDAEDRDLGNALFVNPTASVAYCASVCKGFSYFGMQYRTQCFCGHQHGRHGRSSESDCKMPCAGKANEICGGDWRNSVYHYRGTPEFLGCYVDKEDRDLSAKFETSAGMNVNLCQAICHGYQYFGVQAGSQCFCGNSVGKHGGPAAIKDCNTRCAGNDKDICGGTGRNSVYRNWP